VLSAHKVLFRLEPGSKALQVVRHAASMPRSQAPLGPVLRRELLRLASKPISAAEITRTLGDLANRRGLPRPSYARVRELVAAERLRIREPSWGAVLVDVALGNRPPWAIDEKATGNILKHLPEDAGIRRESGRR
jgi:hypothetical protein